MQGKIQIEQTNVVQGQRMNGGGGGKGKRGDWGEKGDGGNSGRLGENRVRRGGQR